MKTFSVYIQDYINHAFSWFIVVVGVWKVKIDVCRWMATWALSVFDRETKRKA